VQAPRSLILITVDCFRADHAGFMGYGRPTTPFLDCLASESFVFRNAIASGTPTYYSVPAILASRYPLAFGRDLLGIAPDETTIASTLQESGFATAAFSAGNPYISKRFGYDRGFDVFHDFLSTTSFSAGQSGPSSSFRNRANRAFSRTCHAIPGLGTAYDELYFQYCQNVDSGTESLDSLRKFPSADVIVDNATAWVKANRDRPFFVWLHLMDPHAPYFPKSEALRLMRTDTVGARQAKYVNAYWKRGDLSPQRLAKKREQVIALYDAGIRWVDEQVRRLTENLVEVNLWDKCALAITADHGEEFLEHGGRYHPPVKLNDELIHVPLLVRVPGHSPKSIESSTGLIDLAPSLLDALGVPAPADFRGRSWLGAVRKGQPLDRAVITECVHGCTNPFHRGSRLGPRILSVRKGNYKIVLDFSTGADELFDLSCDPAEAAPLPRGVLPGIRKELLDRARKHVMESHKSRDFDRCEAMQMRDLRLEWAHSPAHIAN
jgi:arylsulfatase A-like enzyme